MHTGSLAKGVKVVRTVGQPYTGEEPTISDYAEYAYEPDDSHLSENEAMDRYKTAKELYPDAIVILHRLPCGHYAVDIHKTDLQKKVFYRRTYQDLVEKAVDRVLGNLSEFTK